MSRYIVFTLSLLLFSVVPLSNTATAANVIKGDEIQLFPSEEEKKGFFKKFREAPTTIEVGVPFVTNKLTGSGVLLIGKQYGRWNLQAAVIAPQESYTCENERADCFWETDIQFTVSAKFTLFKKGRFTLETGPKWTSGTPTRISSTPWLISTTLSIEHVNNSCWIPDKTSITHDSNAGFGPNESVCQDVHTLNDWWCPTGQHNLGFDYISTVWYGCSQESRQTLASKEISEKFELFQSRT